MIKINLLPVRAAQKKERLRAQISVLLLCLIMVFIACGFLFIQKKSAIDRVTAEIAEIDAQNRALQKKIGQVRDFEKKKADLEKKLKVLASLKENKSGPVHLLDELSNALPDNLWLTSFKEDGGRITLSGIADAEKTVALFMKSLDASPYYQRIELSVTEQTKVGDNKMQKFTLDCSTESPSSK